MENEQLVSIDALQKSGNRMGVLIAPRKENIFTRKLSIEEQQQLHNALTDFYFVNKGETSDNPVWVLHDDEGEKFTDKRFDFSTLDGFFKYRHQQGLDEGRWRVQLDIRNALGL